ncbi:MAG: hypothetical protein RXR07_09355 [Sulfolobaceae archaeon]
MNLTTKVKVILKSREIIDNWLSLALEYIKGKEKIKIKVTEKNSSLVGGFMRIL